MGKRTGLQTQFQPTEDVKSHMVSLEEEAVVEQVLDRRDVVVGVPAAVVEPGRGSRS